MKKIYIFTNIPGGYSANRLAEETTLTNHECIIYQYADISIQINNNFQPKILYRHEIIPDPDIAIFRGTPKLGITQNTLVQIYSQRKVRILNEKSYLNWPIFSKIFQHLEMNTCNLPILNTTVYAKLKTLPEKTPLPIIIKPANGSMGRGVLKVSHINQISTSNSEPKYEYLTQEFQTAGQDIRIIVLGNKVIGGMMRSAPKGKYLTNYSAGGNIKYIDINNYPQLINMSLQTAQIFNCEYAGIDFMQDNSGNWKILEINRACQFEGFEKATDINVAQKVIDYLVSTT